MKRLPYLALASMAGASIAFESALTRFFALAHYSAYGYWVISIAMSGIALSGILVSLRSERLLRHRDFLLRWLPNLALVFCAMGYLGASLNPFNALELQHPALMGDELVHLSLFDWALLPPFFAIGLYTGLCFTAFESEIPKLYAFDLLGAAAGAFLIFLSMYWLPPFALLFPPLFFLALAGYLSGTPLLSFGLFLLSLGIALVWQPAKISEYKAMTYALQSPGARILSSWSSPRGSYDILDDFNERPDLDLSNNAAAMGISGTPAALGLYVDGNRLEALPKNSYPPSPWFRAALESFPYSLKPRRILLLGTEGGFKAAAVRDLGLQATALESDPELAARIPWPGLIQRPLLPYLREHPGSYELVDMANDFAKNDSFALCEESLEAAYAALAPGGVLSLGLSLKEEGSPAARLIKTLAQIFPADQVLLYRSAWDLRALVFREPATPQSLKALAAFCDKCSFDFSYPGFGSPSAEVWNELPSLGWDGESQDAVRDEAERAFHGEALDAEKDFDLSPSRLDRPYSFSTLKLSRLGAAWAHLSELPLEELDFPINLLVLGQALLLALLVLALPLLAGSWPRGGVGRIAIYFAALGLGYLFFELCLIEKFGPYLRDPSLAFNLVLSGMLFFSGWGSLKPRSLSFAVALISIWSLLAFFFLDPWLLFVSDLATPWQIPLLLLSLAPLAYGLGMPFALGMKELEGHGALFPWAWSLNGALSVVAPPLAYLLSRSLGYSSVAAAALLVYFLAWLFPPQGAL